MSQTTTTETWRERMRRLGREYTELEDMIRTGFLQLTDEDLEKFKAAQKELRGLRQKVGKINNEIGKLKDVETIIKHIRKLRIERVRKERIGRKKQKAIDLAEKRQKEIERKQKTPTYLGDKVSKGLNYTGGDTQKLKEQRLPILQNAEDIANAMQLTMPQISWLSYHRITAKTDHYHRFQIPKRKGGFRSIASPKPTLRTAQSWILENILSKIPVHENAMAFRKNRSITDNAEPHQGKGVVIKMDLKDFFPSIQFRRIKGLYQSFGYNEGVSTIFALICTDAFRVNAQLDGQNFYVALGERYLPQGACTSPTLTNIICRKLDRRLTGLAQKYGFTYTRYADDMVFSHPDKHNKTVAWILKCVKEVIAEEGFILHPDKTAVMRSHRRQAVTGIVVNERMNVSRRDLRKFRSFLHHYEQEGAAAMTKKLRKDATQYAKGYWAFINMVNPERAEKILKKHEWLR